MFAGNKGFVIALDEGTTNAKAIALDGFGNVVAKFSQPLAIQTPREGWVEQSGEALISASLDVISVKRLSAGIVRVENHSMRRLPGNARAVQSFVKHFVARAKSSKLKRLQACLSPRYFPLPRCVGYWNLHLRVCNLPTRVKFVSAPLMPGCYGT